MPPGEDRFSPDFGVTPFVRRCKYNFFAQRRSSESESKTMFFALKILTWREPIFSSVPKPPIGRVGEISFVRDGGKRNISVAGSSSRSQILLREFPEKIPWRNFPAPPVRQKCRLRFRTPGITCPTNQRTGPPTATFAFSQKFSGAFQPQHFSHDELLKFYTGNR